MGADVELATELQRKLRGSLLEAFERSDLRGDVTDIHVNEDAVVRLKTHSGPSTLPTKIDQGRLLDALKMIASESGTPLLDGVCFLSARLPEASPFSRARLQATLPPVSEAPTVSIRIHSRTVFALESFCDAEVAEQITDLVTDEKINVLIVGATGSGKTSFLNSLLQVVTDVHPGDRFVVLEDDPELQVVAEDHTCKRTLGTDYELEDLCRVTLRSDPDRIVIGEVRGPEAYYLIDAWRTGHRGGLCTIHGECASDGLGRLNLAAMGHPRARGSSLNREIASAAGLVIVLSRGFESAQVVSVDRVDRDLANGEFVLHSII